MNRTFTVYCHMLKADGRRYIGITSQNPQKRWNYGSGYDKRTHFGAAVRKYGWSAFEHIILETGLNEKEALKKEQEYISKYQTMDRTKGFNMTAGGEGVSFLKMSPETKEKLRATHIGQKQSPETIQKRKESIAEYYKTHSRPKPSREHIMRMIKAREGMVTWNKGKEWSEEVKQKLREANLGKKAPKETREKMRQSAKKRMVAAYLFDGALYMVFNSLREAAAHFGKEKASHITECCKGKRKQYLNYKWSYYGE